MDILKLADADQEEQRSGGPPLDCPACKARFAMNAADIPRFDWIVRTIGYILLIPTILGLAWAVLMLIAAPIASRNLQEAISRAGGTSDPSALPMLIGVAFALGIATASLVSGLIGFLLVQKRKVYLCAECRFILEMG